MGKKRFNRCVVLALVGVLLSTYVYGIVYGVSEETTATDYTALIEQAEAGDVWAQSYLGYLYYTGEGVQQSYIEAIKWYRAAAEQGNKDAQYNLATAHAFGKGVSQDLTKAAIWYRRAARKDHDQAQFNLGLSYIYGEGVPQDFAEASKWFKKAAQQDHVKAQTYLASLYYIGVGIRQDMQKAIKWYRAAAERGDITAQYNLGILYRLGYSIEQDHIQSRRWLQAAAEQGHKVAQSILSKPERVSDALDQPKPLATPETVVQKEIMAPLDSSPTAGVIAAEKTEEGPISALVEEVGIVPVMTDAAPRNDRADDLLPSPPKDPIALASLPTASKAVATDVTPKANTTISALAATAHGNPIEKERHPPSNKEEIISSMAPDTPKSASNTPFSDIQRQDADTDITVMNEPDQEIVANDSDQHTLSKRDQHTPILTPLAVSGGDNVKYSPDDIYQLSDDIQPDLGPIQKWYAKAAGQGHVITQYNPATSRKSRQQTGSHAAYLRGLDNVLSRPITDTESASGIEKVAVTDIPDRINAVAVDTVHAKPGEQRQHQRFFELLFAADESATAIEKVDTDAQENKQKERSYDAFSVALVAIDKKKYGGAYVLLLPLAKNGNKDAQYHLGRLFHHGLGIKKDDALAASWYRRAAEQGQHEAQYQLGNLLLIGEGIKQSYKEAAYWYLLAAKQGHCVAQYNLRKVQKILAEADRVPTTSSDGSCAPDI